MFKRKNKIGFSKHDLMDLTPLLLTTISTFGILMVIPHLYLSSSHNHNSKANQYLFGPYFVPQSQAGY